ncbi:hypothetical protein DUI87_28986 [Hirundo rustica rustica]|uniref:Uncharacterized protein n=1 Tax=Hirundo rustica rustica TaxID=333673 RepID=A0A3M0J1L9_HIRRU|nr:hypothetical protein DUI87_28986 [Hirundo rustica rustica]
MGTGNTLGFAGMRISEAEIAMLNRTRNSGSSIIPSPDNFHVELNKSGKMQLLNRLPSFLPVLTLLPCRQRSLLPNWACSNHRKVDLVGFWDEIPPCEGSEALRFPGAAVAAPGSLAVPKAKGLEQPGMVEGVPAVG